MQRSILGKPGQFDAGPAEVTIEDRVLETRRKADAKLVTATEPGQRKE